MQLWLQKEINQFRDQKCGLNVQFIRVVTFRRMPAEIAWSGRMLWCLCLFRNPLRQKDQNNKQHRTITPPLSYLTADFNNCGGILSSFWQATKILHVEPKISYFDSLFHDVSQSLEVQWFLAQASPFVLFWHLCNPFPAASCPVNIPTQSLLFTDKTEIFYILIEALLEVVVLWAIIQKRFQWLSLDYTGYE